MNLKSIDQIYPEYYIIKVNEFNDVAKDGLDEWIYFLKNAEIKQDFTAKGLKQAQEKLAFMQMSESQQRDYRAYLKNLRDDASFAFTVKMDIEEAVRKALKEVEEQQRIALAQAEEQRRMALAQAEEQKQIELTQAEEQKQIALTQAEEQKRIELKQQQVDIAKAALQNGVSIEVVMTFTTLSRSEIEKLL